MAPAPGRPRSGRAPWTPRPRHTRGRPVRAAKAPRRAGRADRRRHAADGGIRRRARALRLRGHDPRRALPAAGLRPLARHRQPRPRPLEPDRLRGPHLGHRGVRDDRARDPARDRDRRLERLPRRDVRPGGAARRGRLDVVPLPRHRALGHGGSRPRPAQRHPGPRHHHRRGQLPGDPRGDHRGRAAAPRRGGAGGGGRAAPGRAPARPAERRADDPDPGDDRPGRRDPGRVGALVPRLRRAPALSLVGRDALRLRADAHAPRALDGRLARRRDLARGLRIQHAGRRPSRRARPRLRGQ
jgi:hypothetical protein